jgi:hypothetical protein
MRRSLNAPQRPSQPPQRDDLLFLFFAQDIAHLTERNSPPVQCPDSAIPLAGFQVSTHGQFWVSPEEDIVESGWIVRRHETFVMPTIERDRILQTKLNERIPSLDIAFRLG